VDQGGANGAGRGLWDRVGLLDPGWSLWISVGPMGQGRAYGTGWGFWTQGGACGSGWGQWDRAGLVDLGQSLWSKLRWWEEHLACEGGVSSLGGGAPGINEVVDGDSGI